MVCEIRVLSTTRIKHPFPLHRGQHISKNYTRVQIFQKWNMVFWKLTLLGGVLEKVVFTCWKSVRFVTSSFSGHLECTNKMVLIKLPYSYRNNIEAWIFVALTLTVQKQHFHIYRHPALLYLHRLCNNSSYFLQENPAIEDEKMAFASQKSQQQVELEEENLEVVALKVVGK